MSKRPAMQPLKQPPHRLKVKLDRNGNVVTDPPSKSTPTVEAVAKPPINAGGNVYFANHGSDQAG
jgi:hypothetical protein